MTALPGRALTAPGRPRRLPRRLARRARTRARWRWDRSEQVTLALAMAAVGTAGTVVVGQFGRMLTRRTRARAEDPGEARIVGDSLIADAGQATLDTVAVAATGYAAAPRSETVLFNLLSGFIGAFALVRLSTFGMRGGWWPFGNVRLGGRHIHHFVPGIALAFASGTAALLTDSNAVEDRLAVPMGVGMGLTFDEAALLLDLRDVYWTREGVLSVQVSFGALALLGGSILALRMLSRGEERQEAAGGIPPANPHLAPMA